MRVRRRTLILDGIIGVPFATLLPELLVIGVPACLQAGQRRVDVGGCDHRAALLASAVLALPQRLRKARCRQAAEQ
jgi:hypothetical protein